MSNEVGLVLAHYLSDVAARVAERLGPVAGVAITLGSPADPRTVGASSALAQGVDELQFSIGTGPCLHALRTGEGLYVPDLARDRRWGDYGPRAAALGAACCLSVPVVPNAAPTAVLKVYSATVDGLDAEQQGVAVRAALEVAGGIGLAHRLGDQARELDDRAAAMDTRRVIDLALGILMERTSCDAEQAFSLLRRYSQQYNVKLNEAARQVLGPLASTADRRAPFQRPAGA